MVEENIGLAYKEANKIWRNSQGNLDFDDLFQEATIGLMKAAKKFDASLGFKFSTFAVPVIRGEVLKFIYQDKHNYKRLPNGYEKRKLSSLNEKVYEDGDTEVMDTLVLHEVIDHFESVVIKELIESVELEQRQKELIDLYYYKGYNQVELAKMFGISQPHVGRMINGALKKLRMVI